MRVVERGSIAATPFDGVPVLYYPFGVLQFSDGTSCDGRDLAEQIIARVRPGCKLMLPGTRDGDGGYLWDFDITGGDPAQVDVVRTAAGQRPAVA
jgi:hypothetical protein